ncbi:MAG TPA: hypothetical protein VJ729_16550 [Nitrososphaeraceae archaeon]|nr:hypothetical protein [Nitrososphaeraceae archaeon]
MQKYIMGKQGDFIARPTTMGKKLVVIIPVDYQKELRKVTGKQLKFHWEEIL